MWEVTYEIATICAFYFLYTMPVGCLFTTNDKISTDVFSHEV